MGHPPLLPPPPGLPLPSVPAVRVAPVTDRTGVREWEPVVVQGFPFDDAATQG